LEPFGLAAADLDLIDLYSCFPLAVEAYAAELSLDLGRDLTVTGGMSFAGGPYNNYVLQSTARMGQKLRAAGTGIGLVSSVSGTLTKQGFGLWSATAAPGPFRFTDVTEAVARSVSVKPVVMDYVGSGLVAGYSVVRDKSGPLRSIVVADLDGGRRTVAASMDPAVAVRMQAEEMCGAQIVLHKEGYRLSA
jgi:acetyl-CoA C-acetyltransferase